MELIKWSALCENYEVELREGTQNNPATDVFPINSEDGDRRWKDLKNRVVEHVSCCTTKSYEKCRENGVF